MKPIDAMDGIDTVNAKGTVDVTEAYNEFPHTNDDLHTDRHFLK